VSFNMQNMGNMIKKMQQNMEKMQKELGETVIVGEDPSKKVTCKVNGHKDVLEIKIDAAVMDPDDPSLLEDLVLFAVRDALKKADDLSQQKMGAATKGFPMPNIPGLGF
jgi:nucleoid-associated protein EbfC